MELTVWITIFITPIYREPPKFLSQYLLLGINIGLNSPGRGPEGPITYTSHPAFRMADTRKKDEMQETTERGGDGGEDHRRSIERRRSRSLRSRTRSQSQCRGYRSRSMSRRRERSVSYSGSRSRLRGRRSRRYHSRSRSRSPASYSHRRRGSRNKRYLSPSPPRRREASFSHQWQFEEKIRQQQDQLRQQELEHRLQQLQLDFENMLLRQEAAHKEERRLQDKALDR